MASRLIYTVIIAAVLISALALRIIDPNPIARLRLLAFDVFQQIAPREYDPQLPVRIVDIDEESLKRIGQWPWPRNILAEIVQKLQGLGAAAIGFDLIFSESDRQSPEQFARRLPQTADTEKLRQLILSLPGHDQSFADAIASAKVVLGFISSNTSGKGAPVSKAGFATAGDDPKLFAPAFKGTASSLGIFQEKATGIGSLNWLPQHDQIVRQLPILINVGGKLYPSFAAELLRVAQGASTFIVKASGASGEESFGSQTGITHVRTGNVIIPTGADGQMWLKFTVSDKRRFIPAWKVLSNEVNASDVEGRIILVGTSAAGLFDLRTTPLDPAVPGVEIHAQALEQMLVGAFLRRPDYASAVELLYMLLLGGIIAFLIYHSGAAWSAVLGAGAVVAVGALSWFAYSRIGWLVDPVFPTIVLTAVYITGTGFLYFRTEAERNRVRTAFSYYMAPALVEKLASDPSQLKLGGETRDITLLFCDVRGFTTISEGLDAEALTRFINRLFTPLSNVILENHGTIDKYMGDSIMAFWNAPLDDPDHARQASKAALGIISRLDELNREWAREAVALGEFFTPVRVGIGLNSGPCCVGNLGSEQRFDYSVIGDNVNIASRLEGQTKTYGAKIIAGETTVQGASDLAFLELDLLHVKGKNEPVHLFALVGDENVARSTNFQAWKEQHDRLIAEYRASNWSKASTALEASRGLCEENMTQTYTLYAERLEVFRKTPPPPDWDGSAYADSK
ncbi:adenylate cyclase 1 [bacterium MnTg02]|nr:adenylate cyclase 1 [bacterium MnTg02]